MSLLHIKRVSVTKELEGIRALQLQNLEKNMPAGEAAAEGFVTAEYSLPFLQTMHEQCPSVIAVENEKVVGYALVTLPAIREQHALLGSLIDAIEAIEYKGKKMSDAKFVVVGQLCVAKSHRGIGLVQQLYYFFRQDLSASFDYCITDVAADNPRSLKAHLRTGFEVVDTLDYGGKQWHIVLWDWTK